MLLLQLQYIVFIYDIVNNTLWEPKVALTKVSWNAPNQVQVWPSPYKLGDFCYFCSYKIFRDYPGAAIVPIYIERHPDRQQQNNLQMPIEVEHTPN
jgi:hypothetical protein